MIINLQLCFPDLLFYSEIVFLPVNSYNYISLSRPMNHFIWIIFTFPPLANQPFLYPIYISKNKFTYVVAFKGRDRK